MSSIATVTGCPADTSSATTSFAASRLRSSALHRARAKNQCAWSWLQERDRPAPASIPHTVRAAGRATSPAVTSANVVNAGTVKHGRNASSSSSSDGGNL